MVDTVEQLRLCDRLLDEPDRGVVEAPHLSGATAALVDGVDAGPGPRLGRLLEDFSTPLTFWEAWCPAHAPHIGVLSGA